MDGYQGVLSPDIPQNQSLAAQVSSHTGRPSAPARCAGDESTEITKSRPAAIAAVSP